MSHHSENIDYRSLLEKAFLELRQMRSELEAIEQAKTEPIAIIGMGCRFPGGADNPDKFWQLLRDGVDTITEIPASRWNVEAYYDPDPEVPGKMYTRYGAFLDDVDKFDPQFFGLSPRETLSLDPQQRLLLEVSWEALEHAGQNTEQLNGSQTGVFMGMFMADYSQASFYTSNHKEIDAHRGLGSMRSMAAGRLAYALDLQGPAMQLDTACSSALLAVHLACQSLRTKECHLALAGGVNLIFSPENTISLSKMQAISADGRCRTFDARADGYGRGEGCGVVVLKRFSDAQKHGDNILAIIRGSAVNHDGRSNGLTAPNGAAQETVIRKALEQAQIEPEQIQYIETHGTGTQLGDPIEVLALNTVLCQGRPVNKPLTIGSVKTNIGHLESAAGIVALIKVILSLRQAQIPPHLHFKAPTPYIPWDKLPMVVPTQVTAWPPQEGGRKAGVSSFGMSGTNVHVIVTEAPVSDKNEEIIEPVKRPIHLLSLSAKSESALRALANRYEAFLATHPDAPVADICFTANTGRSLFEHRLAVMGNSTESLQEQVSAFAQKKAVAGVVSGQVNNPKQPKIAFLFTGQGSQSVGMGRQLYETQPTFRQALDRCDDILRDYLEMPLLEVLYPKVQELPVNNSPVTIHNSHKTHELPVDNSQLTIHNSQLNKTAYTQPALFALEYALAKLWQSWGLMPNVVMGHSVGEYVAACIAGVFSLEDGLKLIAARGRLMHTLCEKGDMLVLSVDEAKANEIIQPYTQDVSIAAINGPENIVISGKHDTIEIIMAALDAKGIKTKRLPVSHAFHSPLMEPMLAEFERVASEVTYATPKTPLCSNVTGQLATDEITTPAYWCRHIRQPVRFAASMLTLYQQGYEVFMEIGPKPSLLGMARQCLPENVGIWLPSLRPGWNDWQVLLQSLGEFYVNGGVIDWFGFDKDYPQRKKIPLPTYPFQRQRYWIERTTTGLAPSSNSARRQQVHPLLGTPLYLAEIQDIRFEAQLNQHSPAYLADHQVYGTAILPAASYLEMGLAAGASLFKSDHLLIKGLAIEQALILPEDGATTVQCVLSHNDNKEYRFQIFSLRTDNTDNNLELPNWTRHASGLVGQQKFSEFPQVDLAQLQAQCAQELSVKSHYQQCQKRGLYYGPHFQAIEQLWNGQGEALGRIHLSDSLALEANDYKLHPTLLDACFQVSMVAFPESIKDETYLPVSIEQLKVYRHYGVNLWCHAQIHKIKETNQQTLTVELHLFDDDGISIAKVNGLSVKRANREALRLLYQKDAQPLQENIYEHRWELKKGKASGTQVKKKSATWLIFADGDGMGQTIAEQLEEHEESTVVVTPGSAYASTDMGHFQIRPESREDMQLLIRTVSTHQPACCILHLWSLDVELPDKMTPASFETANGICINVLHLVQAISDLKAPPRLYLVTQGSQAVEGSTKSISPAQAPLWGLGRVIINEHPELHTTMIDLGREDSPEELRSLVAELWRDEREDEVAFRHNARYVHRLTRLSATMNTPQVNEKVKFSADGTFLITGGLSGFGFATAEWLTTQGVRHFALMGRSGASSAQAKERIDALKKTGVNVMVAKADVSDPKQVAGVLSNINQSMPPLKGIIHAANVYDDATLLKMDQERFKKVMAPKAVGAWNLHSQTLNDQLDFFILFSSIASVVGNPGQGNYVAANAFLDALALYRRRTLNQPALTINWGAIADVGYLAQHTDIKKQMEKSGSESLLAEEALKALGELLRLNAVNVTVARMDWSKWAKHHQVGSSPRFSRLMTTTEADIAHAQQHVDFLEKLKAVPVNERRAVLELQIMGLVAQVLGISQSKHIAPHRGFTEIGMDSMLAVELKNRLQTAFACTLPATLTFKYPNISAIVNYFTEEVLSGLFSLKETEAVVWRETDEYAELSEDLDHLSYDDMAEQLAREVAAIRQQG